MIRRLTPDCTSLSCNTLGRLVVIAFVVCLSTLIAATRAAAQLNETSADRSRISAGMLTRVTDTSLQTPFIAPTPVFTLESTSDETTANALVGVQYGDLSLSTKFSGPVRKGASTNLVDLDGLRNKTAIDFGVGWL